MRRLITAGLAAAVSGAACLAALAAPPEMMPAPLEGWTASSLAYGESVITEEEAGGSAARPPKRIEISRNYNSGNGGLKIALNTYDQRGVQIIAYVNTIGAADPTAAAALAEKGVVPFSFGSFKGVAMRTGEEGKVTGAALRLGENGTLTLEGIDGGKPHTATLGDIKAYLERADLDRMADFVREANAGGKSAKPGE